MNKKEIVNITTIVLFVVYMLVVLNWFNYSEKAIDSLVFIIFLLALVILTFCLKIITNKKNAKSIKISFFLVLLCTFAPMIFSLILFLGYFFDSP